MSYPPLFLEITKQEAVTDYALSHSSYLKHMKILRKLSCTKCGQNLGRLSSAVECVVKIKRLLRSNQSGSDCRCTYCWSQHQLLSKAITCRLKRTAWKTGNLIVETTKAHIIQTNAGCVPSLYQGGLNINDVLECLSKAQHTHFILG